MFVYSKNREGIDGMLLLMKDPSGGGAGFIKDPGGAGDKTLGNDPGVGGGYKKEPGGHSQLNDPGTGI